jgi:hypothetical protein
MKLYFTKNNILFILKILLIIFISFLYFIIAEIMKTKFKNRFIHFDKINDSIYSAIKESFDIYIPLKRELDLYEQTLTNCEERGTYKMKLPNILNVYN